MNLGDGLLFELENGKPKLILLNHGFEKNPTKQLPIKPRAAKIFSSRQPVCVEEGEGEERAPRQVAGSHREVKCKAAAEAPVFKSNKISTEGTNAILTSSKAHHRNRSIKAAAKVRDGVKSHRHKPTSTVGPLGTNGNAGQPPNPGTRGGGSADVKDTLTTAAGLKDGVCLTSEELQQILNAGMIPIDDHHAPEEQAAHGNQTDSRAASHGSEEGNEIKNKGGGEELNGERGETDADRNSQEKDKSSRSLFSWLDERQSDSRATVDAKKAQWKRELDEQVALKQQQRSAPGRLQAEEYAESVSSVQTSYSHREQPAAIRSSLTLGEVAPMEEVFSVERREQQRRRWLQELSHQREEAAERRRREKLLQNQTEDHERWASHFDSLQRRPLIQTPAASAPPPGRLSGSEAGDWDPSSSLSLTWEATSSCGAESVVGASVDSTSGYPTRASYLRTMTSLLDPTQIEEKERRRLKQLEQQRAIEAQMEERRKQKEQEEAKRRQEEEEEERRVALEREKLQKQYELEMLKRKQKVESVQHPEQPEEDQRDGRQEETSESSSKQSGGLENTSSSSVSSYRDSAVQTDETPPQTCDVTEHNPPPPPGPSAAPPNSRSLVVKTRKENMCLPAGGDPYEPFARTERSRRAKKRPEWNTHRPSRQYVPASERYPAALQKNRQENRLKRQAELLALQERTHLSRTEPPPPQHQEPRLRSNAQQANSSSTRKEEISPRGQRNPPTLSSDTRRSPPVPAVKHKVQNQQASTPPPVLEFIPYIRTDEVFHLDPLEPADTPPPQTHSGAPPECSSPPPASRGELLLHPELLRNAHTHRQQEILRGLAQLRQGLLQKQKELETDLNPLRNRHDNKQQLSSTMRHT